MNKDQEVVPFILNDIQASYLRDRTKKDIILKARKQGFSSLILALFATDFLLKENSYSVVVADKTENAQGLLERVKFYLASYEQINKVKIPLKYNSKYELDNAVMNSKYIIGTAENRDALRSRTINNLHLSEAAFYPNIEQILASALQALVLDGYCVIETTANGFNTFKSFWDKTKRSETNFKPLFYPASKFYTPEQLKIKKQETGRLYPQEYPESAEEAFITTGSCFFDTDQLKVYLTNIKEPMKDNLIYV